MFHQMNEPPLRIDEDKDSLFGSPPPSPVRGRSPSQETFVAGEETHPTIAIPTTGVGRKNVGTIALPGSHMSCAELPANLPASSLSLPHPTSSRDSSRITPSSSTGTPASLRMSVAVSRSIPSRASSTTGSISSVSASTKKRRASKAKSATPASSAPPITLPGPNEPAPPNLLRSQSSLLGLAGLVGCVKPAQLYANSPQPASVEQSRSQSPIRGSTPAHPIVIDDDRDAPYIGKHSHSQLQVPQNLDQLNPEALRSNIANALAKEKNIFPVLESLVKLLGGEPHLPPSNFPPQPFARPYGHGVFNVQSPLPISFPSAPGSSGTPTIPPLKRRKLKHVPAGAIDWDVPFPFAAGEGPEAYRDTWARDRAKQLLTQLLELVQSATKRAAIKTAKSGGNVSEGRTRVKSSRSSRSGSVEIQMVQASSTRVAFHESSLRGLSPESTAIGKPEMDTLEHFVRSLETHMHPGDEKRVLPELEGVVEADDSAVPCDYDYSGFEEWLSQLQQFVPLGTNTSTPEPDWSTGPSVPPGSSTSSSVQDILVPMQQDASASPHAVRDEAIDPTLLAVSQQAVSILQSESPTSASMLVSGDTALDGSLVLPVLTHSARTSLSSTVGPLTPPSEAFVDVMTIAHQDPIRDFPTLQPVVEKERNSPPRDRDQNGALSAFPTGLTEPPRVAMAQKGREPIDIGVTSPVLTASSRSTPGAAPSSKGTINKRAILERARERRRQLVAEIERAKAEIWETSIENAVLVHFMRDESLSS